MFQGLVNFSGTGESALLIAYVIGGVVMFGAAFLPGNTPFFRGVSGLLGLGLAGWTLKVFLFGGVIFLSVVVLLLPLVLFVRGITETIGWAMHRSAIAAAAQRRYLPAPRPHPGTRQFTGMTEPGYYSNGMRTAPGATVSTGAAHLPRQRPPLPAAPAVAALRPARHRAS